MTTVTALVGSIALAAAVSGYFFAPATWPERAVLIGAALALIFHDPRGDVIGVVLMALVAAVQIIRRKPTRQVSVAGGVGQP